MLFDIPGDGYFLKKESTVFMLPRGKCETLINLSSVCNLSITKNLLLKDFILKQCISLMSDTVQPTHLQGSGRVTFCFKDKG